jgi:hypothetical protein
MRSLQKGYWLRFEKGAFGDVYLYQILIRIKEIVLTSSKHED